MKRVLVAVLFLALCGAVLAPAVPAKVWRVAINQFVEHPALDACRRGFMDYLAEHGYKPGKQIIYDYQNAQANMATAGLIARRQVGGNADLILAIATPSAQASVAAARRRPKPILFTAITDPVGAGLVGKVDAIYVPTDNTVVSALESAVKVAIQNRLPLFATDVASAKRGAAVALGMDYYRLGRQTGAMALR
ncbi:MAG: hypothetical protein KJ621_14500, partial [Proteobacteria bacterium]|nr:hypothetical protein [Pseudomonadota bacterium]